MTTDRLEYLRGEIRAERISQGELIELQGLVDNIDPGDVELLEWAGVPEFPEPKENTRYSYVNVNEEGVVYDRHATAEAALAVQAEFPNDTVQVIETTYDGNWYVIIERSAYGDEPPYVGTPLPDLVVGPYATEQEAEAEGQSDSGIVYCLLTIDAKHNYVCDGDVYWTTEPPADGERITPDKETA